LVGDAAGYVDAITGEGLAVGFPMAAAAVAAVLAEDPQQYERDWRRITRRSRLLTRALLAASQNDAVRGELAGSAARLPSVFRAAVAALA
jgi:flavin-dependent dehydrogenase